MRHRPLVLAAALLVSVGALAGVADADVIGTMPQCQPWEDARLGHGFTRCEPRACRRDAQCSGASCETRRVCIVREEVAVSSRGPCRDRDGDGACDRHLEIREREAGACGPRGRCDEGACRVRGTCRPR
ncbi:MAG: hypothetical protein M3Y87_29365 [Myxococcota bacterium]|nr:hypothetical protein [Myxococcota bacterium]